MVFLFPMAHGSLLSSLDALDAPKYQVFGPVFGGQKSDESNNGMATASVCIQLLGGPKAIALLMP